MESSTSKAEVVKPLFQKAGVPLVLSLVGFVCARIITRKGIMGKASLLETKVNSSETMDSHKDVRDNLDSTSSPLKDEEEIIKSSKLLCSIQSLDGESKVIMLGLRSRIEELQKREWEIEKKFLSYLAMKEQESLLMEQRHMLLLETVRIEFLDREISSMEAENHVFEKLVDDHLRAIEQLEFAKQENGLLQRKVKKLSRKTKEQLRIIAEKNEIIETSETKTSRCYNELDTRNGVIIKLEDEIKELQHIVNQLQEEKNELLRQLKSAETSAASISKIEAEGITVKNYKQLVNELEQLQKDRATENAEVINLRWTNACLRNELMRSHVQLQQMEENKNHLKLRLEGSTQIGNYGSAHHRRASVSGHGESFLGVTGQACPRKQKLIQKLKKWVEGSESLKPKLDEKGKHENRCFGRLSFSEYVEAEHLIHARRSCSSA